MKFTCLQENFSKGLGIVSRAISNNSFQPILSNVLITVKEGRVKLTGFNGNTAITYDMGASIDKEGAITVPINLIKEFVSNVNSTNIDVELKSSALNINTEKSLTKFNGLAAESYPDLPDVSSTSFKFEVDSKNFSDAISSVAFSSSNDDTRPILTGVLLNYRDGKLTVVSADGFRLSEKEIKVDAGKATFSVVVPAKTLLEVSRIFGGSKSPVGITLSEGDSLAIFESDAVRVSTRIINGVFPDYKKLIPEETTHSAIFDAGELLEAVRLTSVFAKGDDSHSPLTFHLNPDGYIKLTAISAETGESHSQIDAQIEGESLTVVFNVKYLLDFLNVIKSGQLTFKSNGNLTPGVLESSEHSNYVHLIMPIRNQG
jgi:DNA polymerase-3 subunit beta